MRLVVDAGVVIACFVPERFSQAAVLWLHGEHDFFAPDLLALEAANAPQRKVKLQEIELGAARAVLADIAGGVIDLWPAAPLVEAACLLAADLGHPAHDCVYLALVESEDALLVTCDAPFCRRVTASPLGDRVRWVEDFPIPDAC